MISGLAITDDNYTVALYILRDRYANESKQTNGLMQKFHAMSTPKHNPKDLRVFLTEYRKIKHQTPRSPWMGGHFERLVRTIKASLVTAMSRKLLTLEEFSTIVKEAENIVNSRPLTYQSDSTRDVPLSPSQLAWGRDLTLMPSLLQPGDTLDGDHDARATRAQYELLSNALERFRKRWHNEYLLSLREKHYNRCAVNPTHHLSVGKLVMVCRDNVHRIEWPLGGHHCNIS